MKTAIRERIIYLLARSSEWSVVRFVAKLASAWLKGMANYSYNIYLNGEMRALRILGTHKLDVVFDVGANVGEWSQIAATAASSAEIHAFELAPKTFQMLAEKTAANPRIKINEFGLADHEGTTDFYHFPDHEVHSSIVALVNYEYTIEKGRIRRGDDYCRENGIGTLDFLKIDVEGAEHLVLQGFSEMLQQGAIRIVQFEYGPPNLASGYLLRNFYEQLKPHGYVIGKIYPHTVKFKAYDPAEENFMGGNFLAVSRTETALISELMGVEERRAKIRLPPSPALAPPPSLNDE